MLSNLRKCLWVQALCLSLWPILAFGQSSDLSRNLDACKSGSQSCDRSKLSSAQLADITSSAHARNVVNCRNVSSSCDLAKLTEPETIALAVANHQRNVSDCSGNCSFILPRLDAAVALRRH